jgi:hypothetical protein
MQCEALNLIASRIAEEAQPEGFLRSAAGTLALISFCTRCFDDSGVDPQHMGDIQCIGMGQQSAAKPVSEEAGQWYASVRLSFTAASKS